MEHQISINGSTGVTTWWKTQKENFNSFKNTQGGGGVVWRRPILIGDLAHFTSLKALIKMGSSCPVLGEANEGSERRQCFEVLKWSITVDMFSLNG